MRTALHVLGRAATRVIRGVRVGVIGVAVLCLRALGLVLPLAVLVPLLWPVAFLWAVWELSRGRPTFGEFRKLAGRLPPLPMEGLTFRKLLLGRARLNLAKFLFIWPERLAAGREVASRIEGGDRLEGLGRGPTILVTLHFGPTGVLLNWLRARGYPVAVVAMAGKPLPWYRRYLIRKRDTPKGLGSRPSLIEVGRVWEMREHLEAGGILLLVIDGGSGRNSAAPIVQNLTLSMSTGALTLAALTGARVVPCLIRSGRNFSLTIRFGEPLEAASVASRSDHPAACDHLFREFLAVIALATEECSCELLAALRTVSPPPNPQRVGEPRRAEPSAAADGAGT